MLRVTPGLRRARSNHALTPCRALAAEELPGAIARVRSFASRHGIRAGIQVSPLGLHPGLEVDLDRGGWSAQPPVIVMIAPPASERGRDQVAIRLADRADERWLAAWSRCDPGHDVDAHARTVFASLRGRAAFAQLGSEAVAIAVESDGLVGLFCMAVAPDHRREGLGTALLNALLGRWQSALAYLQVEEDNAAARALYGRHGFTEAYRYRHRVAPE